jgi:hypothetical protein
MKNLYFKNILESYIKKYILTYDNSNALHNFINFKNQWDYQEKNNYDFENTLNENYFRKVYLSNEKIIYNILTFFSEIILESNNYIEFIIQVKNLMKCDLEPLLKFIIFNTVYDSIKITWIFKRYIHRTIFKKIYNNKIILNELNINSEKIDKFKESEIIYLYENTSDYIKSYKCWWFSSYELLQLLKSGLTNQEFMISNPFIFKNPYSNMEISYIDICNIYNNIIKNVYKNKKIPSWLYLFRSAQFNLQKYKFISQHILYEHCTKTYLESLDKNDYFEHLYDLFIYHDIKQIICTKCINANYNKVFKLFIKPLTTLIIYNNYKDIYYKNELKLSEIIIANIIRNNLWITINHNHL